MDYQDYKDLIDIRTGEISRLHDGIQWDLAVTFRTILNIERDLNFSTAVLALRAGNGVLTLNETATIIWHAQQERSRNGATLEKVTELIFKAGYRSEFFRDVVTVILWYALSGGKVEKKATETAETGSQKSPGDATSAAP